MRGGVGSVYSRGRSQRYDICSGGSHSDTGLADMAERSRFLGVLPHQEYCRERRGKLRIQGPIPARVRGIDAGGKSFDIAAKLDNLSAGGLHVRLERRIKSAARLFFLIRIPAQHDADAPGLLVAARGVARRVETGINGKCGLGVEFQRYRQL